LRTSEIVAIRTAMRVGHQATECIDFEGDDLLERSDGNPWGNS
jgi:hypothetical protein